MAENVETIQELLNESVKQALEKIIFENEIKEYSVKLSPGSNKGDNFIGVVVKAEVTGLNKKCENSVLNVFIKLCPPGENIRAAFYLRDVFLREIFIYDIVIQEMKKIEAERHIEDGFTYHARCLATGTKDLEEFLILEDLSKSNFVMFDRKKELDFQHTQLVMKALGKLHAHSFAMRDKNAELFNKLSKSVPDLIYREDPLEAVKRTIDTFCANAYAVVDVDGIYKEKLDFFYKKFYQRVRECVDGSSAEPYAVISHGDCWKNNMMYRYEDKLPVDIRVVDFQMSRYVSPALDVVNFIFTCTEKHLRDLHYESLLKTYHQSLTSFLIKLGCNPEELFPYPAFQDQLQKFGQFGLISAIFILPLLQDQVTPLENILSNSDHLFEKRDAANFFKRRLTDIIIDLVDLGYI